MLSVLLGLPLVFLLQSDTRNQALAYINNEFSKQPTIQKDQQKRRQDTHPDGDSFSGFFKITAPDELRADEPTLIVELRRRRDKIELIDVGRHRKLTGEVTKVESLEWVRFNLRRGMFQGVYVIEFRRDSHSETSLAAVLVTGQTETELEVEPVLSVWACDNHKNPTHTADSEARIKELSAKNGCTGWHKLELNQ